MDTKLTTNPNTNVNATPPRERTPLPSSSSTTSQTSLSSSPNRNLSNPTSLTSNAPVTVDTLLVQHVNAPNPTHAALEQAVQERNALSAQNSQLWKLIERQRAAYNNLLKENDRIRGDRDSYKSKLLAVLEPSRKRDKEREGEKNLRPAASTPSLTPAQAERPGSSLASRKDQQEDPRKQFSFTFEVLIFVLQLNLKGLPYDLSEPSSAVASPTRPLTPRSDPGR
jgi:RalA-binding protein 1